MKKQVLALLTTLVMVFSLTACGGSDAPNSAPPTETPASVATPAPASTATTAPESALPEGQGVVDAGFFSVAYPNEWSYDEEKASIKEKYANIKFVILDEEKKEKYSVTINAEEDSAKKHRRAFTDPGHDLRDLADGKLNSLTIDGTVFYESAAGETFRYRHDASGINYYVQFSPKNADIGASPYAELLEGIGLHLTDEGMGTVPWPWDGTPWEPDLSPQMAGAFTLTPEYLKADAPIILNSIMNTSFTVVGDLIYTVTKNQFSSYQLGSAGISLQNSVTLDEKYELIRTDNTKKLYLSQGIWNVFVYDGFDKVDAPDIKQHLVMHKSGEWGISFWVNADPQKITVKDGLFKAEPWVLSGLNKDENRVGFFKMISDVRITDSYIIVAGSAADDSGHKIMVYDHQGNEKFALENTKGDRSGLGSVTGIAETKNGFLATDGNMRDIVLWNEKGAYIGTVDVKKLLGATYCWLEDMHLMPDGSILIGISQERQDKSVDELLFFRVTGF